MEKELDRRKLEHLISEFLKTQPTCVIATCSDSIPRASTVEYFPVGLNIYILTEGGKKVENIKKNPRVSIAVSVPFIGWENLRGLQITGAAEIGRKGSKIFNEGLEAYKNRRGLKKASLPDFINIIKVIPIEMDYIDTELQKKGYPARNMLSFKQR